MPLFVASLTGPLVNFATNVIDSLGLVGVLVTCATTGVIGLPGTEPTMLFAGFDVFKGHLSLPGVIVAGVIGDVLGAMVAYGIGYWASQELLERHGSKLHVTPHRLERARRWGDRYGSPLVFVSRLLPGIRAVFPYAAGVSEMPFARFVGFAALGSVAWIGGLAVLGREVGRNWSSWRHHLEYADYVLLALLLAAVAYVVIRRLRGPRSGAAVDAVSK